MSSPDRVTFVYQNADGYRIVPANGAYGGPTTQGDFRIEFYFESPTVPSEVTHETVDGMVGKEVSRRPADVRITRHVQVGVAMSFEQAKRLADWINHQLEQLAHVTPRPGD